MTKKKHVHIPDGFDMNNPPEPPSPAQDFAPFPDEIFDSLPPLLREACYKFTEAEERELFLIGALGVISGMLPNVEAMYDSRRVGANLYCFIVGKYGTGKGALLWARALGEAVETYLEEKTQQEAKEYQTKQMQYNRQVKLYDKGKLNEPPTPPDAPRNLRLYIPANSSKAAIIQLIKENGGRGTIFETEADTLADIFGQDFGDFSDVLRKAYHHEPVSYSRKTNSEFIKITRPALSMVLSGTPDQVKRLLRDIHNGLFSRICFYKLQPRVYFRNPFDSNKNDFEPFFNMQAQQYCVLYKKLEALSEPKIFMLRPHQQEAFRKLFEENKMDLHHNISDELEGTANRLGLICYRIAMILTMVRNNHIGGADIISCMDADYENAVRITQHLLHYSLHVYDQLTPLKTRHPNVATDNIVDKLELIAQCCECYHNEGLTYRKVALKVFGSETYTSKVFTWIMQNCKEKRA